MDEFEAPDLDRIEDPEDDDFSDLDDLLAEATKETEDEKKLKAARKRLAHILRHDHPEQGAEKTSLVTLIRSLEENRIWLTVGVVALFHSQTCETCGATHHFFKGWMTEQRHASDPNARRLLAGRPTENSITVEPVNRRWPERHEEHDQGSVDCCFNCVEQIIAIDNSLAEPL